MRLRKLALAVGMASALGAEMASALGLGEIKLNSTLNQPLDAEIRLLQVRDLTPDEILVALATREDFSRAGVDRPFFLTDLKFIVKLDGPSGPMVRVTSRKPVREPYLNFLLETQWPNGRLLREYTLLMDLPVFSEDRAAPVTRAQRPSAQQQAPSRPQAPAQPASQSQEQEAPAQTQPSRSDQSASTSGYGSAGDVYGPVSGSDTLWEIALKARPSRQFSVQQTMLAIQRLNPEAFINGNINLLRKGQVLRLPKANQIAGLNSQQAVNEVAYQNTQWSGDPNGKTSGPQLEAGKRLAEKAQTRDTVEGRLKLASGGADGAESGRTDGADGGDVDALQNELAISLEELDRSQRENSELKERVAELEDQISTMERLVEVSNEQLRALQLASKQEGESADSEVDTAVDKTDVETVAEAPVVKDSSAKDPAAETEKSAPKEVVKSTPKPAEPSLIDSLLDNILLIGAGLLAIIGALVVFLRRRGESEEEQDQGLERLPDEDDFESPFAEAEELEDELPLDTADEFEADDALSLDEPEAGLAAESDELLDTELDFDDAGASGEAETDDAVGEADIYIAYGKLDQAEDMLVKAIAADPANTAARLKLMEVYVESSNLTAFDQQYAQVIGDASSRDRADELRAQFADAPAFDAGSVLDAETAPDVAEPVAGSDDGFGELDLTEEFQTESEADTDLTLDFDDAELGLDDVSLDADADLATESEGPEATTESVGSEEDDALDFNFDDLDLDDGVVESATSEAEVAEAVPTTSDDALDELSLDLDLTDLDTEDQVVDLDFDLGDLDEPEGDLSAEGGAGEITGFDSDLSLDLDDIAEDLELETSELASAEMEDAEVEGAEAEGVEETSTLSTSDDDLSIDFDLGDLSTDDSDAADAATDDSFELDLDFESTETSTEQPEVAADEELSLDLGGDFGLSDDTLGDSILEEPATEAEPVVEDLSVTAEVSTEFDSTDDFDLADLDADMDLAALDQEVDALAGNLDMASEEFGEDAAPAEAPLLEEPATEAPVMEEPLSDFGELDLSLDSDMSSVALAEDSLADVDEELSLDLNEGLSVADDLSVEEAPVMEEPLSDDLMSFDMDASVSEEPAAVEEGPEEEPEFDIAADLGIDLDAEPEAASEDDVFDAALSDIPSSTAEDLALDDDVMDEDLDAELDFLADTDEAATKLDLARAYIDMGDKDGAKDILSEVVAEGNTDQKKDAEELLSRIH